jgi:hypothetical protein|tara:strand:- start:554 stop:1762 length:1209 start_codon:yes stop_codon:yes gene_type:complete
MGSDKGASVQPCTYGSANLIFVVVRYLPLALLTPLSALCVEAVAQPHKAPAQLEVGDSDASYRLAHQPMIASSESDVERAQDNEDQSLEITQSKETDETKEFEPLVLSQSNDSESSSEEEQDAEDSWRFYLDLYAFAPLSTNTTTQLNGGNPVDAHSSLSDVLASTRMGLTFKASAEYGRIGVYSGVNYGAAYQSDNVATWKTTNSVRNAIGIPSNRIKVERENSVDATIETSQFIYDLAVRYRAGDIQKPKMEKGSASFVGFVGARFIDGWMTTTIDVNRKRTLSADGQILNREQTKEFENSASGTWANTWVQPLIGMLATYAISEDWQAFAYLDAGGFGLAGERDQTGTAQAGIAYALGNSAQASLSYKYFGLDYAGGGSGNGYTSTQSGINFGLRWLFD